MVGFIGLVGRVHVRAFVVGLFQEGEPKDLRYLFYELWVLWAHLYGFGTFALGFVPNRSQGIVLSF